MISSLVGSRLRRLANANLCRATGGHCDATSRIADLRTASPRTRHADARVCKRRGACRACSASRGHRECTRSRRLCRSTPHPRRAAAGAGPARAAVAKPLLRMSTPTAVRIFIGDLHCRCCRSTLRRAVRSLRCSLSFTTTSCYAPETLRARARRSSLTTYSAFVISGVGRETPKTKHRRA